jgi:hypothetical protein
MNLIIKKAPGGYSYTIGKGENAVTGWSTCREYIERLRDRYARRRYETAGLDWRAIEDARRTTGARR